MKQDNCKILKCVLYVVLGLTLAIVFSLKQECKAILGNPSSSFIDIDKGQTITQSFFPGKDNDIYIYIL